MRINEIYFHDLLINSVKIIAERKTISIEYQNYREETGTYQSKEICFKEISDIRINAPEIKNPEKMELFSLEESEFDNCRQISCTILTGFGGANMELSFKFLNAELDGVILE